MNNKKLLMKRLLSLFTAVVISVCFLSAAGISASAASASSQAGVVATSSGRLNVRASASTSAAVVASLNKGSYVTLLSLSGSWWKVEYADGKYGYCHKDYIQTISSKIATVNTSSTNLNVRSGPGTGYGIIGSLAKGKTVLVLSESSGFSRVLYDGVKTGYVSSSYLKSSQTYAAVSLPLPDFKQTDSRWANVIIGNSGKTIARIGCTTTAIAMMESYRNGVTIYPDAMSKKLSYSSSGDLYWPGDYVNVTNSSGYLNAVYNLLKQGKPVLVGAKTSAGKQHWVVVTGYTGGDTLTASKFTVNDPGSQYRTTLQHLFNEYPVFYKYVYYR